MIILYSCFASVCPRKIMPLFTYIQLQIIAGFPCRWWSYSSSHLKFLPKLQGLSFSRTNLALLCCAKLPNPVGPFSCLCLWLTTPNSGKLAPRLCTKKMYTGQSNQNKTTYEVYRHLSFTSLYGGHLSSHEPKTQIRISWRYSWFQICFHWQIPTPMARSKCKWGYDQESLNSWKYCRICC